MIHDKARTLEFAPRFERSLRESLEWWTAHDRGAPPGKLLMTVWRGARRLCETPELGSEIGRGRRKLVLRSVNYVLVYRIAPDGRTVRLLHLIRARHRR